MMKKRMREREREREKEKEDDQKFIALNIIYSQLLSIFATGMPQVSSVMIREGGV